MDQKHVDFLEAYLRLHPELSRTLRTRPPAHFDGRRWRPVRGVRMHPWGLRLEFGRGASIDVPVGSGVRSQRRGFAEAFLPAVRRHQNAWAVSRVLEGTDRVRHHSAAILRVLLRNGNRTRAIVAVPPDQDRSLGSRLLVTLTLWWESLRPSAQDVQIYLPAGWSERLLGLLPRLTIPVACHQYEPVDLNLGAEIAFRTIYPVGERETEIRSPYKIFPLRRDVPSPLRSMQAAHPDTDILFRKNRWELSFRGLPLAWADARGQIVVPGRRGHHNSDSAAQIDIEALLRSLRKSRTFGFRNAERPEAVAYRERWLESVVMRNLGVVNPDFAGAAAYCQVPTSIDEERRILDILTVTSSGRLAVLELKVNRDLNLIFQGLDYWDRVDYHRRRGDFQRAGYFSGLRLSSELPLLYLVSPVFEFHRVMPTLRRFLSKRIPIHCIGINSDWERSFQVIRRVRI